MHSKPMRDKGTSRLEATTPMRGMGVTGRVGVLGGLTWVETIRSGKRCAPDSLENGNG